MRTWFKFVFGGFFSNQILINNTHRRFMNALLAFFLAMIIHFLGLYWGAVSAFPLHLDRAEPYTMAIQRAFDNGLVVEIDDGVASSNQLVNTFENEVDALQYKESNIDIIVDTRDIDSMFVTVMIKAWLNQEEITYDSYLVLSASELENALLDVTITDDIIDLAVFKAEAEAYLDLVTNPQNPRFISNIAIEYNALSQNTNLSADEYNRQLYGIYAKVYYPDLTEYNYSVAPTMRDYYSSLASRDDQYLIITANSCVGSFLSNNVPIDFNGNYTLIDDFTSETDSTSRLLLDSFRSSHQVIALIYIINLLQVFPYVLLLWIILTVLVFALAKMAKLKPASDLFADLTIIGSLLLVTSAISGLVGYISNYFASKAIAYLLATLSLYLVFAIRSLFFIIPEMRKQLRKNREAKVNS